MSRRPSQRIGCLFILLASLAHAQQQQRSNFEPYQLNGGLVAAVAGRDFCVTASDTRLMDGGYEIYTRNHLRSRLWMATSTSENDNVCNTDGSLVIPMENVQVTTKSAPPVWIASAGCSADCEALKRIVRSDVRASSFWNSSLKVNQVASLLSQVLYRRRSFPYYSFCVVSGLGEGGGGQVYAYDAIGSYEQVAVATSGTGRELLQPILDRLFGSFPSKQESAETTRGIQAVVRSPVVVQTQVDCTADQAVSILIRAYRSVSEREIGVGDKVVLCVTQKDIEDTTTIRVLSAPLKQH